MAHRGRHLAPSIRRISRTWVLPLTLVMTLVLGGVAWADNLEDTLVAGGSGTTISMEEGQNFSTTISYEVDKTGGNNTTFPATVSFSLEAAASSSVPSWASLSASSLSFSDWDAPKTLTVSGTAPTGSAGTYQFRVEPSTSASNLNVTPGRVQFSITVTPPAAPSDTQAPQNASIEIDDGAAWTNSTSVTVDIAATDNVGVTKYRLATTQAGLDTAPDVTVTSSTNFSVEDLTFTLAGPDGTNSAWVRFFDAAGNSADVSDTIGLDRTKPVISASTGTYLLGTWTNQSVLVSFDCADAGSVQSGIATDTVASGDATLSSDGEDQFVSSSGSCIDNAGNAADGITVIDIDIDKTKPTSVVSGFTNGAVYNLGDTLPTATCSDSDNLSGIETGGTLSGPTGSGTTNPNGVGTFTFSCNGAVDNAGNTQTAPDTKSYSVIFRWAGFYAPVENLSTWNSAKAGQSIPVKFSLSGDQGLTIFEAAAPYNGGPRIVQVACPSSSTPDPIEEYATSTANSKLIYDSLVDQYNYVWKTDKAWAGKCFRLDVKLIDGTIHSANFKFTK